MKTFACGDVVPGCEAKWVCSADDELLVLVAEHAASTHGINATGPEFAETVSQHIVATS